MKPTSFGPNRRVIRPITHVAYVVGIGFAVTVAVFCRGKPEVKAPIQSNPETIDGEISGSVYVKLGLDRRLIAAPDLTVTLIDEKDAKKVESTITDPLGHYIFARQAPGKYSVRIKALGWQEPEPRQLSVQAGPVYNRPIVLAPTVDDKSEVPKGALFGRLELADGSPPWFHNETFGVNSNANVTVYQGDNKINVTPVVANAAGEFVVPDVPRADRLRIEVALEKLKATWPVTADQVFVGKPVKPPVFKLNKHPPRIISMMGKVPQSGIVLVHSGEWIRCLAKVRVTDKGQPLKYRWAISGEATPPQSVDTDDGSTIRWEAPKSPGLHTIYALVEDGSGGYDVASMAITVGTDTLPKSMLAQPAVNDSGTTVPTTVPAPPSTGPAFNRGNKKVQPLTVYVESGSEVGATTYYNNVDPQSRRKTLGEWWEANKFNQKGELIPSEPPESHAAYLNDNDLGSGRDMHFLTHANGTVSAYVTNYGRFDRNPENADAALNRTASLIGATVCMEYSPVEQGPNANRRIVKFFAYGGGTAEAARALKVDLDETGERFLPNICLACHGGKYRPSAAQPPVFPNETRSVFREFDVNTFKFPRPPGTPPNDPSRRTPSSTEQHQFHELNLRVRDLIQDASKQPNTPKSPALLELINGWYPNGSFVQKLDFIPEGWQTTPSRTADENKRIRILYSGVVARSCRTCHIAETSQAELTWATFESFKGMQDPIYTLVVDRMQMPQAVVTFHNFWHAELRSPADDLLDFQVDGWEKFPPPVK